MQTRAGEVLPESLRRGGVPEYRMLSAGASAFAEALKMNKSLTSLSLAGHGLGRSAAVAISAAFAVNMSLHRTLIDLEYGAGCAPGVPPRLTPPPSPLPSLSFNYIDAEGARLLLEAFTVEGVFKFLDLSHNDLTEDERLELLRSAGTAVSLEV